MPKLSLSLPALDLPEVRFAVTTAHVAQVVRVPDSAHATAAVRPCAAAAVTQLPAGVRAAGG